MCSFPNAQGLLRTCVNERSVSDREEAAATRLFAHRRKSTIRATTRKLRPVRPTWGSSGVHECSQLLPRCPSQYEPAGAWRVRVLADEFAPGGLRSSGRRAVIQTAKEARGPCRSQDVVYPAVTGWRRELRKGRGDRLWGDGSYGTATAVPGPPQQENGEQPSGSSSSVLGRPQAASRSTWSRGHRERWMKN